MTRLQDDFYHAINGEWEKTAVIPDDKPRTGGFSDLADEIEDLMLATTDQWLAGENVPDNAILQNFIKFHRMATDFDKREALGIEPVKPWIEEYKQLSSFSEFASKIADYEMSGKPNEFPFGVSPDFMNAQLNVLWAAAPSIILPDTTYYTEDNEKGKELLGIWREMEEELLEKYGFTAEEIKDILDKVIALDAKLAKYVLSSEESSEYVELYHPYDWEDFTKLAPELPLDNIFTEILGQVPDKVIVPEERFWTEFAAEYYSEDNWELLKASLLINATTIWNAYLTDELRILAGKYDSQRLFIVARKPDRFLRLIEAGVQLETLNVGNMSQSDETRAITRSINVVDADVEDFNKIHEKGVKITSQMVPNDTAEDFMKLLK